MVYSVMTCTHKQNHVTITFYKEIKLPALPQAAHIHLIINIGILLTGFTFNELIFKFQHACLYTPDNKSFTNLLHFNSHSYLYVF